MNITLDTWIISDTHFGHHNIIKHCNRPENHDALMIYNWNKYISPKEDVLHLGDLVWWRTTDWSFLRKLNGNKNLIIGNHDKHVQNWYENYDFMPAPKKLFYNYDGKIVLLTHKPEIDYPNWDINIHGHIHNNGYGSMYPRDRDYRNVSIEVMEFRPYTLREILEGKYESIKNAKLNEYHGANPSRSYYLGD